MDDRVSRSGEITHSGLNALFCSNIIIRQKEKKQCVFYQIRQRTM